MSSSSNSDDERRTEHRGEVILVVEYPGAEDLLEDYSTNLSVGGTFVHTERELDKGSSVELILSFPGLLRPIQLAGVVRWSSRGGDEAPSGVGIEFVDHDEAARAHLAALIDAIARGDADVVGRVMHYLIAIDNPHIAGLIRDGLTQGAQKSFAAPIAFEFGYVDDGLQAQEVLEGEAPVDVLLIDMALPPRGGAEVIRAMRTLEHRAPVPVIGIANGDPTEARAAGCDHVLPKPLRLRSLLDTVARILDGLDGGSASTS